MIEGLFEEAALHDAVVLFDECDRLLAPGSRRLGLMLDELERQEGIVVLATNAPERLDPALDRRIVYRMDFDVPGPLEREQIWELHLPPEAALADDIDITLLAQQFNFSGGLVKNAVLVALNRAIERDPDAPVLDMAALEAAAASQLRYNLGPPNRPPDVLGGADRPPDDCGGRLGGPDVSEG